MHVEHWDEVGVYPGHRRPEISTSGGVGWGFWAEVLVEDRTSTAGVDRCSRS